MPQLKAVEQTQFGGVDSRSNAINMPSNRFLLCRNWKPRPDGHLELRDGYTLITPTDGGMGAVHSITPYLVATPQRGMPGGSQPFPNGTECVLFWRGTVPYLRRVDTGATVTPPIDGAAIAASTRWHYALGKTGYLYMHNGTDMKFFDGIKFRDIGLPVLSNAALGTIGVATGLESPDPTDIASATFALDNTILNCGPPGGSAFLCPWTNTPGYLYYAFFDTSTNIVAPCSSPIGNTQYPTATYGNLQITWPTPPTTTNPAIVGLCAINEGGKPGAVWVAYQNLNATPVADRIGFMNNATMAPVDATTVEVTFSGFTSGGHNLDPAATIPYVIALSYPSGSTTPVAWKSGGPFTVTSIPTSTTFRFKVPDSTNYTGTVGVTVLAVSPGSSPLSILYGLPSSPPGQGVQTAIDGTILVPYADLPNSKLLPASTIGGAQPGYQFYVSIYNPLTGHVGNRTPIGQRLKNTGDTAVIISGLPADFSSPASAQLVAWGNGTELPADSGPIKQGQVYGSASVPASSEWQLLIGRTGDGGEVPYTIIDNDGNWVTYAPPGTTSDETIIIEEQNIDGNSELPFENYIPPPFLNFWREGDRQCGSIPNQPFVYRSASEVDATTGIFVGDPAQSWSPARIETLPTAQAIYGGFGYMQESWVFSKSDCGQLSELSGEVAWNGPYNFGIIGPFAFDKGWQSLPYWISHDKQLCTMLPNADGPIPISTEYETALLFRIGAGHLADTELVYFRDPEKLIEVLRIKCLDSNGNPFVVIHDFSLRDDASPYGQGYEEDYAVNSPLASPFTQAWVRDAIGHARIWAGGGDGNLYQFHDGGDDSGTPFIADAINLRYMSGEHVATKTLEWYGDQNILWFIYENMLDVVLDSTQWVNLTFEARPVPGDAGNAHFMADLQRPEMTHCYLWAQLTAHNQDMPDPTNPMALSVPPHLPLETYGRLYLAAPILGDARGR